MVRKNGLLDGTIEMDSLDGTMKWKPRWYDKMDSLDGTIKWNSQMVR